MCGVCGGECVCGVCSVSGVRGVCLMPGIEYYSQKQHCSSVVHEVNFF